MHPVDNIELASSLRTVSSQLFHVLRQRMLNTENLSISEITTVSNLYNRGAMFPTEMAAMIQVKTQSMTQIINRLNRLNYLIKTPSATDKRKVSISLSDQGRQMVDRTRHERDEWLTRTIEQNFSTAEKKLLVEAIKLLTKIAGSK